MLIVPPVGTSVPVGAADVGSFDVPLPPHAAATTPRTATTAIQRIAFLMRKPPLSKAHRWCAGPVPSPVNPIYAGSRVRGLRCHVSRKFGRWSRDRHLPFTHRCQAPRERNAPP